MEDKGGGGDKMYIKQPNSFLASFSYRLITLLIHNPLLLKFHSDFHGIKPPVFHTIYFGRLLQHSLLQHCIYIVQLPFYIVVLAWDSQENNVCM